MPTKQTLVMAISTPLNAVNMLHTKAINCVFSVRIGCSIAQLAVWQYKFSQSTKYICEHIWYNLHAFNLIIGWHVQHH